MKSNTGETWTYERGTIKCTEGNPKVIIKNNFKITRIG
jgi:hypothetical protein